MQYREGVGGGRIRSPRCSWRRRGPWGTATPPGRGTKPGGGTGARHKSELVGVPPAPLDKGAPRPPPCTVPRPGGPPPPPPLDCEVPRPDHTTPKTPRAPPPQPDMLESGSSPHPPAPAWEGGRRTRPPPAVPKTGPGIAGLMRLWEGGPPWDGATRPPTRGTSRETRTDSRWGTQVRGRGSTVQPEPKIKEKSDEKYVVGTFPFPCTSSFGVF